jgi:hypothetical protein
MTDPPMNEPVPVTGIWLRNIVIGPVDVPTIEVLAEIDGEWRLVIDEMGEGPISHIVEPGGMRSAPRDYLRRRR